MEGNGLGCPLIGGRYMPFQNWLILFPVTSSVVCGRNKYVLKLFLGKDCIDILGDGTVT